MRLVAGLEWYDALRAGFLASLCMILATELLILATSALILATIMRFLASSAFILATACGQLLRADGGARVVRHVVLILLSGELAWCDVLRAGILASLCGTLATDLLILATIMRFLASLAFILATPQV